MIYLNYSKWFIWIIRNDISMKLLWKIIFKKRKNNQQRKSRSYLLKKIRNIQTNFVRTSIIWKFTVWKRTIRFSRKVMSRLRAKNSKGYPEIFCQLLKSEIKSKPISFEGHQWCLHVFFSAPSKVLLYIWFPMAFLLWDSIDFLFLVSWIFFKF